MPRFSLLSGVFGLALGAAFGFGAGVWTSSEEPGAERTSRVEHAGALVRSSAAPADFGGDANRAGAPRRATGDAAGAATVTLPEPPRGEGAITGVVRDGEGRGVPGVRVRAAPRIRPEPPDSDSPDEDVALPARIARLEAELRFRRAHRSDAETDASGNFEVRGLGPTDHTVKAWKSGWSVERAGEERVRPGARVDFVATKLERLLIDVRLPDGSAPTSARIRFGSTAREDDWGRFSWTPENPAIEVGAGRYRITANSGEAQEFESEPVEVTAGSVDPLVLSLVARPGVRGRVQFPGPWPGGVRISLVRAEPGEAPSITRAVVAKDKTWVSESSPEFLFVPVEPGEWSLVASTAVGRVLGSEPVTVVAGVSSRDLLLPDAGPELRLRVRVVGPGGEPAAVSKLRAGYSAGSASFSCDTDPRKEPDGSWSLPLPVHDAPHFGSSSGSGSDADHAKLTNARWWIEASAAGLARGRIDGVIPGAEPVELRLQPAATLRLTVRGARTRIADQLVAQVSGADTKDRNSIGFERISGPLGPVAAGECHVAVGLEMRWRTLVLLSREVVLTPGTNELEVELPPIHPVRVALPAGVSAPSLNAVLRRPGEDPADLIHEGSDSHVEWPALPAGRLELSSDRGMMVVAVNGPVNVTFAPREADALRVSLDDDGRQAAAGFREDDLVVAIDGADFAGEKQIRSAVAAARAKDAASRFTVLRDGGRVHIDAVASALGEPFGWPFTVR